MYYYILLLILIIIIYYIYIKNKKNKSCRSINARCLDSSGSTIKIKEFEKTFF